MGTETWDGVMGDDDALPRPLTRAEASDGCVDARFEDWYRDHYERLRSLCARILSDPSGAEDMAQEALLRAWLGRERMREQDVGAWLSVVARNLCVSHMRKRWRAVPHDVLPDVPNVDADPAVEAVRAETCRSVRRALEQVGDRHRRLLLQREIAGVDYVALGDELGLTPSGARAVLFRARRSLKDRLAAAGEGLGGWILGVRLKLRQTQSRFSDGWSAAQGVFTPALQAGLGVALSVGLSAPATALVGQSVGREPAMHRSSQAAAPVLQIRTPSGESPSDAPSKPILIRPRGSGGSGFDTTVGTKDKPSAGGTTENPLNGERTGFLFYFDDRRGPVSGPLMDQYGAFCERTNDTCERLDDLDERIGGTH